MDGMLTFRVTIPLARPLRWPVSANQMRSVQTYYLSRKAACWRSLVESEVARAWCAVPESERRALLGPPHERRPLRLHLHWWLDCAARADADNLLKLTVDGIRDAIRLTEGRKGFDDSRFRPTVDLERGTAPYRLVVTITTLAPQQRALSGSPPSSERESRGGQSPSEAGSGLSAGGAG